MPYYLIRIQEIPESGWELNVSSEKDSWFKRVVGDSISSQVSSFDATLSAKITKVERSIELTGGVYLKLNLLCDRCMNDFLFEQQIPFRLLLEPSIQDKGRGVALEDEVEEMDEAVDVSYYSGDDVDIGDLMRQHILMAQPMRHVCNEDCKGLCPTCGKNLNKGTCECMAEASESPFAVLKQMRGKQNP